MKHLSKILSLVLAVVFVLSLSACSPKPPVSDEGTLDITTGIPSDNGEEKDVPVYLKNKATKAGRVTLEKDSDCPTDFVLNVEGDDEIKILQLTDTQMIDETQVRLGNGAVSTRYADHDNCIYDIVDYVIEQTQPDLILITGDYVYGDYDDNGTLFREQTDYFDSKGIFWAPMFGNHDGDSDSDYAVWIDEDYPEWYTRKQCQYFENSPYCLFRTRVSVSGYSNYSIAIKQNDQIKRSIFMIDTKGYNHSTIEITTAQLNWYKETVTAVNEYAGAQVPQYIGTHVALDVFLTAAQEKYGYVAGTSDWVVPENDDGDSGRLRSTPGGISGNANTKAFNTFKEYGADAILAGHQHQNNASILYQGIRLVFGTKSSRYDKYGEDMLGGTLFTGIGSDFTVEHIYYVEPV